MKRHVTLFCHTPTQSSSAETEQELMRQHNFLTEYAYKNDLSVEHCFFHEGPLEIQHPDDVLSRFLYYAQAGSIGLVLIENMDIIPIDQRNQFPSMQIYSVYDGIQISVNQKTAELSEHSYPRTKAFGYCRHANASQIDKG